MGSSRGSIKRGSDRGSRGTSGGYTKSMISRIYTVMAIVIGMSAPAAYEEYVFHDAQRNIVRVYNQELTGGGTGFFISTSDGLTVITNEHVCIGASQGSNRVVLENDGKRTGGTIILKSAFVDLCAIKPDSTFNATGLEFASRIYQAQKIKVIGHPLLRNLTEAEGRTVGVSQASVIVAYRSGPKAPCPTNSTPTISLLYGFIPVPACMRTYNIVQISATVFPGNSGSPVFNSFGNVVGVVFLGEGYTNYGDIVPLNEIKVFLVALEQHLLLARQQSAPSRSPSVESGYLHSSQ